MVIAALAMSSLGYGQSFPSKPIRIVVPNPPGGSLDIMARLVAQRTSESLGSPVVVENRPGGDGVIGSEMVARAAPDGYAIIVANASSHTANFYLMKNLPYHPLNDFTPIVGGVESITCLVVQSALPVNNVTELVEYAKKFPGKLSYSATGASGAYTISAEAFKKMAGADILHVTYKGLAPAMTAVLSGEVNLTFTSYTVALPQLKAGKIRAIGVAEAKRYSGLPNVPTVGETVPGYKGNSIWNGFMGPAKMPETLVNRLNTEMLKALTHPDTVAKLDGTDIIGGTPQAFGAYVRNEIEAFGRLVKLLGLKPE
jgi:tripartite-type tricarboxylate transporter receptor subunit TctC